MAAKPSILSEEFVADSSDDDGQENISRAETAARNAEISIRTGKASNGKETFSLEQDLDPDAVSEVNDVDEDETASDSESGDSAHILAESSRLLNGKKRPSPVANVQELPRKKMKATAKVPAAIPAREYNPPSGFEQSMYTSKDLAPDFTKFLSADLVGKEVWHITAPASVDIKSIDGFSIKDILSGKPILSQNGADYGFCTDSQRNEKLLMADGAKVEYVQAGVVSKMFHLREITTTKEVFRHSKADSENHNIRFTAQAIPPKNRPRQQPAGLRMRYHPFGSVAEPRKSAIPRENKAGSQTLADLSEDDIQEPLNLENTTRKREKRSRETQGKPELDSKQTDRVWSSSAVEGEPLQSSQVMSEVADGQSTPKVTSAKKEKRLKKRKKHHIVDEIGA